eukprot:417671-Pelagomonas_calceolata.AAC.1
MPDPTRVPYPARGRRESAGGFLRKVCKFPIGTPAWGVGSLQANLAGSPGSTRPQKYLFNKFVPAKSRGARLIQVELSSTPATGRGSGYKQAHA